MFQLNELFGLFQAGGLIALEDLSNEFNYWSLINGGYAEINEDMLIITPLGTSLVMNSMDMLE